MHVVAFVAVTETPGSINWKRDMILTSHTKWPYTLVFNNYNDDNDDGGLETITCSIVGISLVFATGPDPEIDHPTSVGPVTIAPSQPMLRHVDCQLTDLDHSLAWSNRHTYVYVHGIDSYRSSYQKHHALHTYTIMPLAWVGFDCNKI